MLQQLRWQVGKKVRAASIVFAAIGAAASDAILDPRGALGATTATDTVRIIVQLRETGTEGADQVAKAGRSLNAALGRGGLDALNARYGVRNIRPLRVPDAHIPTIAGRRAAEDVRRSHAPRLRGPAARTTLPTFTSTYVFELPPGSDVDEATRAYAADPAVAYAEPDRVRTVNLLPNDPFLASAGSWNQGFADLWGIHQIEAPAAWDVTRGLGVLIAISDTGIDIAHPDLAANVWVNPGEIAGNGLDDDGNGYVDDINGWNSVAENANVFDDHGHGTHVAGTAAAVGNNGTGVAGVAFESRVMALKGFNFNGSGNDSDLAEGILYAVENGARVINASWGGYGTSQTIADALVVASAAGVVFVAAAGNADEDIDHVASLLTGSTRAYPAGDRNAIAVAAVDHLDQKAFFSNFGLKVDVAAPGGGDAGAQSIFDPFRSVLSLRSSGAGNAMTGSGQLVVGGSYIRQAGTSMAAPHVSGAAALILSAHPEYSAEQVRQALRAGADDVDAPGFDEHAGYGRLNVAGALQVNALAAHIASPGNYALMSGTTLTLTGSAYGAGFASYRIEQEFAPQPGVWVPLVGPVFTEVFDGTLAVADISALPDGYHTIRLVVEDAAGASFEDRVRIIIDRIEVTAPLPGSIHRGGGVLELRGSVAPADLVNYTIEYYTVEPPTVAHGFPSTSPWTTNGLTVAGGGQSAVTDGLLGTFDTTVLAGAREIAFRFTVNTQSGPKQVWLSNVIVDPTLKAGWPVKLSHGFFGTHPLRVAGKHSPTLVDLDGDGTTDILLNWGSSIHAFRADGSELPGWPVAIPNDPPADSAPAESGPSVADLDGDGDLEVVATRKDRIFVFNRDGSPVPGWPRAFRGTWNVDCTLADLDGNGTREIIFTSTAEVYGDTAQVHAVRLDGTSLPGFPAAPEVQRRGDYGAVSVGDVDGDGSPELAVSWRAIDGALFRSKKLRLYVFDSQGRVKPGFPRNIGQSPFPHSRNGDNITTPPILADLNADGILDVAAGNHRTLNKINAFTGRGKRIPVKFKLPYYDHNINRDRQDPLVAADLTGDGLPELFTSTDTYPDCFLDCGGILGYDFLIAVTPGRSPVAGMLPAFPIHFSFIGHNKNHGAGTPAIGDINGDGRRDIVVGSGLCRSGYEVTSGCFGVWAFERDGTLMPGFPKPTQAASDPFAMVALGDLEGDGTVEVVSLDFSGYVMVWEVPGTPGLPNLQWPMARQNPAHTGALPVGS